ncbi:uracil-DNA glycosylase family protein [Pseudoalteromonas denitrificans]|uniref:Uracil-DNA glycosylase n=1 Tax=Pseudoalteromonas denitrificans DSM 6059 TaxID=1123010 RepID=A0A1I1LPV0_9GAMM|nr:uracil-DNA glycosylase family protein [Pseudoalteromonas denitrificans]SFC72978.1 Uracil-DNA glycosylase [Pseudoalteromonas denitrificans DSM 6059]
MLENLIEQVKFCTLCQENLPLGPRPVIQLSHKSKILIAGQAPGLKVHKTGLPFNDASGDRLREWLGVTQEVFYDDTQFAILPMGFCYPGKGKSGDLPPRAECASTWREKLLNELKNIELTIVIGQYAQAYHLPKSSNNVLKKMSKKVTDNVKNWQDFWPQIIPLPHPSPRNNIWLKRNPWFKAELLPPLKDRVHSILERSSIE